jgi:translocation and assembly module TamA
MLAALQLLTWGCASSSGDLDAGVAPVLDALDFQGNTAFSASDLRSGLANQPSGLFATRRFDDAAFPGDLDRVVNYYRSRGFFDARIVDTSIRPDGKGAVAITITIEQGLPSKVADIQVLGISDLPAEVQKALKGSYPLVAGEIFHEEAYLATKQLIAQRLLEHAYLTAEVIGRAEVNPTTHLVSVRFDIRAGPRYQYSGFDISGNVVVPTKRIANALSQFITPGHYFTASELQGAQKRLNEMGVFATVQVIPGKPNPLTDTVPIEVRVSEAPFHTVRLGAGVGIDVTHQEVHVLASYTDRNFLGDLRRLDFDNQLALVWVPSVLEAYPGYSYQPTFKSTLRLTQPEITRDVDLSVSLQVQRQVELGYKYWAIRGQVAFPWRVSRSVTFTPSYNIEATFFDAQSFNGFDLSPTALLSLDCSTCILSYLQQSVVWDRRDDPVFTTRGIYASLDVQEAGLGGNFFDFAVHPQVRAYFPLTPSDVLAARLEAGWLFGIAGSATPVTQRFFLGGLSSARGYGSTRLSPMVRVNTCSAPPLPGSTTNPLCTTPGNSIGVIDVPVGGNNMISATLELRHQFSKVIGVTLFADLAQVNDDVSHLSFDAFSLSTGIGLRITTPVGPFRLDAAYRVINPVRRILNTEGYGQQPAPCGGKNEPACYYPYPDTSAGAVDQCGYPFVPITGWEYQGNPYGRPSTCKSDFLDRLNISIAIGEAF